MLKGGGSIYVCMLPCTPTTQVASSNLKVGDEHSS